MKSKIIALALFAATAATVAFFPLTGSTGTVTPSLVAPTQIDSSANQRPKIEVVFVLDTTGSMGGLIKAAKEKIWSIATTMASAQSAPEIKMGLVAYRDRGDAYVTRVVDLSDDLDQVNATLMDFKAAGGGDGPESVNQALYDAVHNISWNQDSQTYKVVFLVGDAPPHMDYLNDVKYPLTLDAAKHKGIVVNTIQAGSMGQTKHQWQQIAQLGSGRYFQVGQAGNAVAIATPFDRKLAELSAKLDATRLYYGTKEEKVKQRRKIAATTKLREKSSLETRARRATFNVSKSGKANLLGKGDLIDDLDSGRVELSSVPQAKLPAAMQAMPLKELEAKVEEQAQERKDLKRQIQAQAAQRAEYIKKKVDKLGGARDSLDDKIYSAVRAQAASKGLVYESEAPNY